MTSEMVLYHDEHDCIPLPPSGAVASPDTTQPPDFSVENPARNWYFAFDYPRGTERRTVAASPREITQQAQRRLNEMFARQGRGVPVRDDGILDSDSLWQMAQRIAGDGASTDLTSRIPAEMVNAALYSKRLTPQAWTGVVLWSMMDPSERSRVEMEAWLRRGGIAFGTTAQLPNVKLPAIVETSGLQRTWPRTMNFVRNNKVPLAVGGGLLVAGLVTWAVYSAQRQEY